MIGIDRYGKNSERDYYLEQKIRLDAFYASLERIRWERWCWQWNEYRFHYIALICITVLIHRRLMFSMSGWLARAGYKKRTGK